MHDRLIPFDRVLNFRDFGGWETVEGARLARGVLYRSASFHDATETDIERLEAMNVRFMVDLRRPEERAHEPNRWPGDQWASLPPPALAAQALAATDLTNLSLIATPNFTASHAN